MNAREVNETFDLVSYVNGIVSLHKSGAYYIGPCPCCGGRDRFQIKHTQTGDVWICRKCHADNKYHSVIDFFKAYKNTDFKGALALAGGTVETQPRRELGKPVIQPAPVQVLPSDEWQRKAWQRVDEAAKRLRYDEQGGQAGRDYLASRGIDRGTILANHIGYDPAKFDSITKTRRPAITIPHLDLGETISAIKYRFIDDLAADKDYRFTALSGSLFYLYGLQNILESDKTLLFVEGEINCLSIQQAHPRGVSVVSPGSQTIKNETYTLLQALARHYTRVVIWMDEAEEARTVRERMNRPEARLLKSPVIDGVKFDANEMLRRGLLWEFISAELKTQCERVELSLEGTRYLNWTKAEA